MSVPVSEFIDVTVAVGAVPAAKFGFGGLMGAFEFIGGDRQYGPFFSTKELADAALGSPEAELWAARVFAQTRGAPSVIIGRKDAIDADWTVALDAIETDDEGSTYWLNIQDRDDTSLAEAQSWCSTRFKMFVAQSDDIAVTQFGLWDVANAGRVAGLYYHDDLEHADGAMTSILAGFDLDAPGGAGVITGKVAKDIAPSKLTGAQALAIYAVNANLYGTSENVAFYSKGNMPGGQAIATQVTADWIKKRSQEAWIFALTSTPTKIPYTQAGIVTACTALQAPMDRAVTSGQLSDDFPASVIIPDINKIPAEDRAKKELTVTSFGTLAGSIEKVFYNVTLPF